MAEERLILTPAGYEQLQADLRALEARWKEDLEAFRDVNYDVDPSREMAAYFETRTAKEYTEERINYLRMILERAEVITDDPDPLRVDPGERVTVWNVQERQEMIFDLLSQPEILQGRQGISLESPVGQALLGRRVGDVVDVEIPDGKVRYVIRRIERLSEIES